MHFESIWKP